MLVLTLCADLLYAVYVSITLNGKESFFFFSLLRGKYRTVNWIFTKTGKNNTQPSGERNTIHYSSAQRNVWNKLFGSEEPERKVIFYRKDNCAGVSFSALLLGGIYSLCLWESGKLTGKWAKRPLTDGCKVWHAREPVCSWNWNTRASFYLKMSKLQSVQFLDLWLRKQKIII